MRRHPQPHPRARAARGFNLAEIVIASSLVLTVGAVSGPPLAGFLHRSKVEGAAYEVSAVMRASRAIAVTRGANTVVQLDPSTGAIVAFADVHGSTSTEEGDGVFNPLAGMPERLTDYEIARVTLPSGVRFVEPGGGEDLDSVVGFENGDPLPQKRAIFYEDGSVERPGAFRIADGRGNYFEIATTSRAAHVEVRKWDGSSYWLSRGDDGAWKWR